MSTVTGGTPEPLGAQRFDAQPFDAQRFDAQRFDAQPLDAQPLDALFEEEPPVRAAVTTIPGGGSWLRVALAAATLATMVVLWVPGQGSGQAWLERLLMAGVFWWLVARPGSAAAVVLLIGALGLRISPGKPELDGSLVALTVLLPLVHQLAALCVVVPLRANVQWPALLPTAVRYVGVVTATVLGLLVSSLLGWW